MKTGWNLFEKLKTIGNDKGAFGTIYLVKCLQSTKLYTDGQTRILLDDLLTVQTKQMEQ